MISSGDRIGPTAHYTGYVWSRNGLSHPALTTREGRILFDSLQAAMLASRYSPHMVKLPALERFMRPGSNPDNPD